MAAVKVAWMYTDDNGKNYLIAQKREIAEQDTGGATPFTLIGGREATAADALESMPNGLKPRGVTVTNAAGKNRFVICATSDAPLYKGTTTDVGGDAVHITLRDALGATSVYSRQKPRGEQQEKLGVHTTS